MLVSQDIAVPDITRFNALALLSELGNGQESRRWYTNIDVANVMLKNTAFINTSFLGGTWSDIGVVDSTFSGAFWSKEKGFTMSGTDFRNVDVFGSEMEAITLINVAFVNTKFRGSVVDTTNFSKGPLCYRRNRRLKEIQ